MTKDPHDQRQGKQNQKHKEQDLRDTGRGTGDPPETQTCGDQGNDEECQGPTKHGTSPLLSFKLFSTAPSKAL